MCNGNRLATLAAAMSVAFMMAGCGGGDGSGSAAPMPGDDMTAPMPGDDETTPTRSGGIAAGARNRPRSGESVTQSSAGAGGVTTDAISVELRSTGDGQVDYRVANGEEWFLGSDDPETTTVVNLGGQQRVSSGLTVTGVSAIKGQGGQIGSSTARINDGIGVAFYTDIEGTQDGDYLVWGTWGVIEDAEAAHRDTVQGAFAAGSEPFGQAGLAALTGTARYRGDVDGRYFDPDGVPGGRSFSARATLDAAFGDAGSPGAISGRVDRFRFNEGDRFVSRPTVAVTLERTGIGDTDSGFFRGTSRGTYLNGAALSGQWGGRFYGVGESGDHPGSVAGTFGAASDDGTRGLIGAFGAHGP